MTKPKVFLTQPIPQPGIDVLKKHTQLTIGKPAVVLPKELLIRKIKGCDGVLSMLADKIDGEIINSAPQLKGIANYAVGFDNIEVSAATARKIYVTNTPGVLAETTADLAWALLMAAARRIVESDQYTRTGQWNSWRADLLLGQDIHHATLGIIGMGQIGSEMARRGTGFNMRIIYHNRTRNKAYEKQFGAKYVTLKTLLQESDFITLHCPLTPETKGLIGTTEFKQMKPNCIFINASRGAVVDQKALYNALKTRKIAGAGLDVYAKEPIEPDNPILKLSNIVFTPHIGSASVQTRTKMAVMAAENLIAILQGKQPKNWVNKF